MNRPVISCLTVMIILLTACKDDPKPITLPLVSTGEITGVTVNSATISGEVLSDGNSTIIERGIALGLNAEPTIAGTRITAGSGVGKFTSNASGLAPATTYHVRAYATNSTGTSYGQDATFTTTAGLPLLSTTIGTATSSQSALVGGTVDSDQGGVITSRGICYGTSSSPTTAGSKTEVAGTTGSFEKDIIGLNPSTVYYARSYAINSAGIGYGPQVTFTTAGPIVDIDGNSYTFIKIGTQLWFTQNLRTTRYKNGDAIALVSDDVAWSQLITGGYCYYGNNQNNDQIYGKLYNWYAGIDVRGLCPTGWHVPSDSEWLVLSTFLGGESVAGGKIKSTGTTLWVSPNTVGTNETGFNGLPGGYRSTNNIAAFEQIGESAIWWSTTPVSSATAWHRYLLNDNAGLLHDGGSYKVNGFSVRCVKD